MAEQIYKFWICRFLEPWHQLSEEEQDRFSTKIHDALHETPSKSNAFQTRSR